MPDTHALLSASAAERWLNCPGSVLATKDIPDRQTTFSAEGTLAHSLCELKVRKQYSIPAPMSRAEYKKQHDAIKADPLYQPEMEDCSDLYLEHIHETLLSVNEPGIVDVEQRVDFSEYVPGGFGTTDCRIVFTTELHIFDYKHGKGVFVSAKENPQMKLYALGSWLQIRCFCPRIQKIVIHVIQPRVQNISVWETCVADLIAWATDVVTPAAKQALTPGAPFKPGESQCRFCKIRNRCRARAELAAAVQDGSSFRKLPPVLSDEEVADALDVAKQVSDWLEKLSDYASKRLVSGGSIPGYKLVAGRTTRVWADQAAAFETLKQSGISDALLYERNPITVAKLEKLVDKKTFASVVEPLIVQSPGKPTMVPEADSRPAWSPAKADFADLIKSNKGE